MSGDEELVKIAAEAIHSAYCYTPRDSCDALIKGRDTDRARAVLDAVRNRIAAEAWDEGYRQGIADEATSQDWTGGQVPPARANPYYQEPA